MKTTDTLTDFLQLAKTVESTVQMETLSKQLIQNIGILVMTTEVHAMQKHHHSKNKHFQSNPRSTSSGKSSSWDKGEKKCGNCGHSHPPKQCPAYGKECFQMQEEPFLKTLLEFRKMPGGEGGNPKCFSRKDIHEVENTKFEYDTDIVEFKQIQFSTPVFDSSQDSLNSQNIMLYEMSESGKLHHALADVRLENKGGISSQVRFKLDTRLPGDLLPVSVYCELFPHYNR